MATHNSSVRIYDDDGIIQNTILLPTVTSYGLKIRTFAFSERSGNQVVFYSGVTDATPASDVGSATIYAYDVTAAIALPSVDVRARVTSGIYLQVDSLTTLTDGTLVASWTETDLQVGRSWGTRTTLVAYDDTNAVVLEQRLQTSDAYGYGFFADGTSVNQVYISTAGATALLWKLWQIQLDTAGDAITTVHSASIPTPPAVTDFLPFFVTGIERFPVTVSQSPGPFTGEPPIRWLRRTPHEIIDSKRVFFGKTELLADVGVGGTANTVTQRYSNDGAQTFSGAQTKSLGIGGATTTRVYWNQNGSGRDRVWEWYGDGDAPARLVDMFVDIKGGTS